MIDKNSFLARKSMIKSGKKQTREQMIFQKLYFGDNLMTARQLLKALFPNSDDVNKTRPRLSDMLKDGAVKKCGETMEGGLPVTVFGVNWPVEEKPQMELGL